MDIRSAAKLPERVQITFPSEEGRAKQSMADECDINNIMAKYQKSGALTHVNQHGAEYGYADSVQFHDAMNIVADGNTMFADLPSSLRNRFVEPGAFLDFVQDEANAEEMIELGLRDPVATQEPPEARTGEPPPAGEIVVPATSEAAIAAAEASD